MLMLLSFARALVASLVILLAVAWAMGGSSSFNHCIQEKQQQASDNYPVEKLSALGLEINIRRDCFLLFVKEHKDEVLAAFTVLLTFGTIFLWFATGDLVRGAERTAKRQLRAYLGVTGRNGVPSLTVGEKQSWGIVIKNNGQTPALRVRYWGEVIIREHPLSAPLKSLKFSDLSFPINPGVSRPVVWETNDVLTAAEESAVRNGTHMFYIYGEVEYFDIFNSRGTATFRYRYGGERLIRLGAGDICEEGNNQT